MIKFYDFKNLTHLRCFVNDKTNQIQAGVEWMIVPMMYS
jgi:hypothetical protein